MVRYEDSPYNDLDTANNYEINHPEGFSFQFKRGKLLIYIQACIYFSKCPMWLLCIEQIMTDSLSSYKI